MEIGRVGIVLPGGGCKCAFQIGALKFLEEKGVIAEKIQGISGGAMNAAKFVESGVAALDRAWREVERIGPKAVFTGNRAWNLAWHNNALYTDEGLNSLALQLDIPRVTGSTVKLEVVVTNEMTEFKEIFVNHDFHGDLKRGELFRRLIKASASMPGFFQPEKFDADHIYSDGCFFSLKTFAGFDTVFIMDTSQPHVPTDYCEYFFLNRMMKRFSTMIDANGQEEIEIFVRTHKYRVVPESEDKQPLLLRGFKEAFNDIGGGFGEFFKGLIGLPMRRLVVISPRVNIPTLRLDGFKIGDIAQSIEHGYDCAAEVFKELE